MSELISLQTGPVRVNTWIVPLVRNMVFIVDPAGCSLTGDEGRITGFLTEHNLQPVSVVLTHGHFDHVIGLPAVRQAYPDIKIAINANDRSGLGSTAAAYHKRVLAALGGSVILPAVSHLPDADCLLDDGKTLADAFDLNYCLSVCGDSGADVHKAFSAWKILLTPGHTSGSVCLYNEAAKTLISGDTLFYHSYGRTDLSGGSEPDMLHSINCLKASIPPDVIVYPGHDYAGFPFSDAF